MNSVISSFVDITIPVKDLSLAGKEFINKHQYFFHFDENGNSPSKEQVLSYLNRWNEIEWYVDIPGKSIESINKCNEWIIFSKYNQHFTGYLIFIDIQGFGEHPVTFNKVTPVFLYK